jgi:4-amino-4-deoxy-L-arabinose transferase-like glycosyltransferase
MKPHATPHAPLGGRIERTDRVWALAAGAVTTIAAAVLASVVFGRIPHVQDSIAQLFQARIFAGGRLWAPAPPLPAFFEAAHMIVKDGRWFSQYPPGHALLLVPGVWLGVPWLVNPVLGGLAVVGIYFLARELFDRATARVSAALAVLSPFLLLMSAEFMSHVGSLFALTFYLLFYFRTIRRRDTRDGVIAGAFLALALLIRPYSAFGVALPTWVHAAWRLRAERRALARPLAWTALGGAAGIVLLLLYNWGTTGSPLRFGYTELYGPSHGLGFGKGSWGPPHTLGRGLAATWQTLAALNARLFEWPLTSLWPAVLGLLIPTQRYPAGRRVGLALIPVTLLGVYVFYWFSDLCFGPRFVYEALAPILILSAIGLIAGSRWIATQFLPHRGGRDATLVGLLVAVLFSAGGAVTRWPRLFEAPPGIAALPPESPVRQGSYFRHFGHEYWGVGPYLGELVEARIHEPAIVFVHFREPQADHVLPLRNLGFGSAFARQSPYFGRARIIYAHDLGARNAELMARFPQRKAYVYRGSLQSGTLEELPRPG